MAHRLLRVLVGAAHVAAAGAALGSPVELTQKEAPWERAHGAGVNASLREQLLAKRRLQTTSTVTLPEITMLMSVYRCVMCLSNAQDYCPVTSSCASVGACSSGCSTCNNPGGGFCDYVTPGGDAEMLCINYVVNDLLPVVLCTPSQNSCECYEGGAGSAATTTTTTAAPPLFNCDVDVASWLISWSDAKMAYCCAHVGFGCTSSTTTLSSSTTVPTTVIASTTPTTAAPTTVATTTNTATTATTTATTAAAATTDTTTATATTTITTTFTVVV